MYWLYRDLRLIYWPSLKWTTDHYILKDSEVPPSQWCLPVWIVAIRANNRSSVENIFWRRSLRDSFLLERLSRSEVLPNRFLWENAHPTVHLRTCAVIIACVTWAGLSYEARGCYASPLQLPVLPRPQVVVIRTDGGGVGCITGKIVSILSLYP